MKNLKVFMSSHIIALLFLLPQKIEGMEQGSRDDEMARIHCLWHLGPKVYKAAALEILEKKILQHPSQENHELRITYLKKLGDFLKENPTHHIELKVLKPADGKGKLEISNFYNETINLINSTSLSNEEKDFKVLKAKTFSRNIPGEISKSNFEECSRDINKLYRKLQMSDLPQTLQSKLEYFHNFYVKPSVDVELLTDMAQQASRAATINQKPDETQALNHLAAKISFKLATSVPSNLSNEKKLSRQYSYYNQSSQLGYALSTYYLADLLNTETYEGEISSFYDFEKAYKYYLDSARQKNPFAIYKIAKILEIGDERLYIDPDKKKAQEWHKRAAEQGHPYSQYELAIEFMENQQEEEGLLFLQKSAESGYSKAQLSLAQKYDEGYKNITKNPDLAIFWYHKAAEQEEGKAAYYPLGYAYEIRKDYKKSISFYKESKDARAHVRLGNMYLKGKGKEKNDVMAVEHFDNAAKQGNSKGNYYLGLMKLKGQGFNKPKLEEAFSNFTAAAGQNHPKALLQLGVMKQFGLGTKQSYEEAKEPRKNNIYI